MHRWRLYIVPYQCKHRAWGALFEIMNFMRALKLWPVQEGTGESEHTAFCVSARVPSLVFQARPLAV